MQNNQLFYEWCVRSYLMSILNEQNISENFDDKRKRD